MTIAIPALNTERLILRAFREDDFEPMADFYADPISAFYGGPCNREEGWRKFAAFAGHWMLRGTVHGRSKSETPAPTLA